MNHTILVKCIKQYSIHNSYWTNTSLTEFHFKRYRNKQKLNRILMLRHINYSELIIVINILECFSFTIVICGVL